MEIKQKETIKQSTHLLSADIRSISKCVEMITRSREFLIVCVTFSQARPSSEKIVSVPSTRGCGLQYVNFILFTIFTGQGHISKVLVIPEFSKCQVHVFLEIILLKYFFLKFFEPCIYFSGLLRPNRTGLNSGLNQTYRRQLVLMYRLTYISPTQEPQDLPI